MPLVWDQNLQPRRCQATAAVREVQAAQVAWQCAAAQPVRGRSACPRCVRCGLRLAHPASPHRLLAALLSSKTAPGGCVNGVSRKFAHGPMRAAACCLAVFATAGAAAVAAAAGACFAAAAMPLLAVVSSFRVACQVPPAWQLQRANTSANCRLQQPAGLWREGFWLLQPFLWLFCWLGIPTDGCCCTRVTRQRRPCRAGRGAPLPASSCQSLAQHSHAACQKDSLNHVDQQLLHGYGFEGLPCVYLHLNKGGSRRVGGEWSHRRRAQGLTLRRPSRLHPDYRAYLLSLGCRKC